MDPRKGPILQRAGVAVTSCALALAACGSSGSMPNASADPYGPASSPAALSRCMRANGVSGFPDPIAADGGGIGLPLTVNSGGWLTAEGKTFAGPAVRTAERACARYLPPAGGPPAQLLASQRRQELALARCMRAHGVPSFPDPTSAGESQTGLTAGIDPQSPAFQSAARVCGAGRGGSIAIGG